MNAMPVLDWSIATLRARNLLEYTTATVGLVEHVKDCTGLDSGVGDTWAVFNYQQLFNDYHKASDDEKKAEKKDK